MSRTAPTLRRLALSVLRPLLISAAVISAPVISAPVI
jgi:hypothetical protein